MGQGKHSVAVILARALIRVYQIAASGWPSRCRFAPSCSAYAREALTEHGFFRGLGYAGLRILRCHPWNSGGYDPIPLRRL